MYECEKCNELLPEINNDNFKQTSGGRGYHPEFGEYYWFEGELKCDNCGHVNLISDQSI